MQQDQYGAKNPACSAALQLSVACCTSREFWFPMPDGQARSRISLHWRFGDSPDTWYNAVFLDGAQVR